MSYGFKVEVKGDYALFSRPELKVERYSYDIMTPSAARGILEAVMWKPAIRYVIDKIHVINEVRFTNIRRNEVSEKLLASTALQAVNGSDKPLFIATKDKIQQRASTLLRDVYYIIEAHFEMTEHAGEHDNPEKFRCMIMRRLQKGQCFHQPYLGCREFPAKVALVEGEIPRSHYAAIEEKDLGLMLYDMDFTDPANIHPLFFRAVLRRGELDLTNCEVMT